MAWRSTVIDPAYRVTGGPRNEAGERVTTAYRIRAERPTTLLVGSSRVIVGMYIEHGAQDGFFNASMSGASLHTRQPCEHEERCLMRAGGSPLVAATCAALHGRRES